MHESPHTHTSRCMHEVHAASFAQIHRCKLCPGVTLRCFRSSDKKNARFYMKLLLLRGNDKCSAFVWIEACACESSGYTQIPAHIRVVPSCLWIICNRFEASFSPHCWTAQGLSTVGSGSSSSSFHTGALSESGSPWSRPSTTAAQISQAAGSGSAGGSRRRPCVDDGGRGALWDLKYCTRFSAASFTYNPASEDNSLDFTAWVFSDLDCQLWDLFIEKVFLSK